MKPKNIIVIGGGIAGLATAALAAQAGHYVTILEKNESFGGRARSFDKKGFSFDRGPSWYLMPEVFEHFFAHFGKKTSDYYHLKRLDPRYQVHYEDGSFLTLEDDVEANKKMFEEIEPGAAQALEEYLQMLQKNYQLALQLLYYDIFQPRSYFNLKFWKTSLRLLFNFNVFQSWHSLTQHFFTNSKLQKILEFPAVFLGGSPSNTPALFALLSATEAYGGVWYPRGGMIKVVDALQSLTESQGAVLKTNADVTKIEVKGSHVQGVWVGKTFYPADVVVGCGDLAHLEMKLLEPQHQTYPASYWSQKKPAISALCLYLGLKKRLTKKPHHVLYFTENWNEHFKAIFEGEKVPRELSFYASLRSMTDRTIVPDGGEEIFVLVPMPATSLTPIQCQKIRKSVMSKLESLLKTSFGEDLVVNEFYSASEFIADHHAYAGTALGLAPTLMQSLWLRPGSQSRKVKGLYYAGQFTNPGAGVPMALISAELAVRRINDTD